MKVRGALSKDDIARLQVSGENELKELPRLDLLDGKRERIRRE